MLGIFDGFKRGLEQEIVDISRGAKDLVCPPSMLTKITRDAQDLWREVKPELKKAGEMVQDLLENVGETAQKLWENNVSKKEKFGEIFRKRSHSTGESSTGESSTGSPRGKKQCISLEQYRNSNNNKETNSSLEAHKLNYLLEAHALEAHKLNYWLKEHADYSLETREDWGDNNDANLIGMQNDPTISTNNLVDGCD